MAFKLDLGEQKFEGRRITHCAWSAAKARFRFRLQKPIWINSEDELWATEYGIERRAGGQVVELVPVVAPNGE